MTCQATSGQCPVFNVQGSLVCPVSNIHTFSSCAPWGNSFCLRQQAKCKSFIKHYSQNCSALRLCHSPTIFLSLSFNVAFVVPLRFWQLWRQCLISRPIACTHTGTHAQRGTERERESARGGWTYCLASNAHSAVYLCVFACACVWNGRRSIAFRWQFINFISSSLHLFLAHTHTYNCTSFMETVCFFLSLWLYLLPLSFDQLILLSPYKCQILPAHAHSPSPMRYVLANIEVFSRVAQCITHHAQVNNLARAVAVRWTSFSQSPTQLPSRVCFCLVFYYYVSRHAFYLAVYCILVVVFLMVFIPFHHWKGYANFMEMYVHI